MAGRKPNSLAIKAPHLRSEWSPENTVSFDDVTLVYKEKCLWICPLGHKWEATVRKRIRRDRGTGCSECFKIVPIERSLATKAPWLRSEWGPNNTEPFDGVFARASWPKREWVCSKGHVWWAVPCTRAGKSRSGCPECSGHRVSAANSLATKAPHLEKEWHPDNEERFCDTPYGAKEKRKWICSKGHVWFSSPNNRTKPGKPQGCSRCTHRHSKAELAIFSDIKEKYTDAVSGVRSVLRYKRLELDIYIPSLKKAIEYDGVYWHSLPGSEDKDRRKNEQCAEAGIQLLRIPEAEYEADRAGTIKKILEWLVVY